MTQKILFLCPHNAAKSVIASAYARRLADEMGLEVAIHSAGTYPDAFTAPQVVSRLRAESLDVSNHVPRKVTQEDLEAVDWIISIGDDIEGIVPDGKRIKQWSDVPAPSRDIDGACRVIEERIHRLLAELSAD
jgi:arsenate reductase